MGSIKIKIENIMLLLFITTSISIYSIAKKNEVEHILQAQKTAIIFELDGVLFDEYRNGYIQKIGFGSLARYKMSNWQDPGDACLDMLEYISKHEKKQPATSVLRKGRKMPCCIHDWQCGQKNHKEVRSELAKHIEHLDKENYFKNKHQKYIHQRIVDISLDPEQLADIAKPNRPMMQLVKKLKNNGYKLYILANLSHEQYEQLTCKYADFTKLFDDIIISAQVKTVKPNNQIFKHLLTKHKLDAQSCVLIDNQKENVHSAQQLGIASILFDNRYREIIKKLQQLGITC